MNSVELIYIQIEVLKHRPPRRKRKKEKEKKFNATGTEKYKRYTKNLLGIRSKRNRKKFKSFYKQTNKQTKKKGKLIL